MYSPPARGRRVCVVRCPVCEGATVTVVLNSKPHASCGSCGATWIQEGSWQRAVRVSQRPLSIDDVIVLPDPVERPRTRPAPEPPAEQALA